MYIYITLYSTLSNRRSINTFDHIQRTRSASPKKKSLRVRLLRTFHESVSPASFPFYPPIHIFLPSLLSPRLLRFAVFRAYNAHVTNAYKLLNSLEIWTFRDFRRCPATPRARTACFASGSAEGAKIRYFQTLWPGPRFNDRPWTVAGIR